VSREFEHDADEARRAARITDSIKQRCAETCAAGGVAKRATAKGRLKAFAVEPDVTINNGWSNRYTMVEMTGLDRPGLLFELTATLSKLNPQNRLRPPSPRSASAWSTFSTCRPVRSEDHLGHAPGDDQRALIGLLSSRTMRRRRQERGG